jgi:hypothetical protein
MIKGSILQGDIVINNVDASTTENQIYKAKLIRIQGKIDKSNFVAKDSTSLIK